jgi:hypothetical protein
MDLLDRCGGLIRAVGRHLRRYDLGPSNALGGAEHVRRGECRRGTEARYVESMGTAGGDPVSSSSQPSPMPSPSRDRRVGRDPADAVLLDGASRAAAVISPRVRLSYRGSVRIRRSRAKGGVTVVGPSSRGIEGEQGTCGRRRSPACTELGEERRCAPARRSVDSDRVIGMWSQPRLAPLRPPTSGRRAGEDSSRYPRAVRPELHGSTRGRRDAVASVAAQHRHRGGLRWYRWRGQRRRRLSSTTCSIAGPSARASRSVEHGHVHAGGKDDRRRPVTVDVNAPRLWNLVASAGRIHRPWIARHQVLMGWWVGPSSPRPTESGTTQARPRPTAPPAGLRAVVVAKIRNVRRTGNAAGQHHPFMISPCRAAGRVDWRPAKSSQIGIPLTRASVAGRGSAPPPWSGTTSRSRQARSSGPCGGEVHRRPRTGA